MVSVANLDSACLCPTQGRDHGLPSSAYICSPSLSKGDEGLAWRQHGDWPGETRGPRTHAMSRAAGSAFPNKAQTRA